MSADGRTDPPTPDPLVGLDPLDALRSIAQHSDDPGSRWVAQKSLDRAAALPSASDQRLREALASVQFAHRHLLGDSDVTCEDASHSLVEAERSIRAALSEATTSPEATLDVELLAEAIWGVEASRPDHTAAGAFTWGTFDDEARDLFRLEARTLAAEYARLARLRGPA